MCHNVVKERELFGSIYLNKSEWMKGHAVIGIKKICLVVEDGMLVISFYLEEGIFGWWEFLVCVPRSSQTTNKTKRKNAFHNICVLIRSWTILFLIDQYKARDWIWLNKFIFSINFKGANNLRTKISWTFPNNDFYKTHLMNIIKLNLFM